MTKATMPEPAAYPSDAWVVAFFGEPDDCGFYLFRGDFGNIAYRFQCAAQASNLVTTAQAEAYADARVRETLEKAADTCAGIAIPTSHDAPNKQVALECALAIRALLPSTPARPESE